MHQHDRDNAKTSSSMDSVLPDSTPPQPRLVLEPIIVQGDSAASTTSPVVRGTLCMLHGWAQNSNVFANRAKKLIKRVRQAGYRVLLLQAPHRLPPKNHPELKGQGDEMKQQPSQSREYAYGWFLYNPDDPSHDSTPVPSTTGDYPGMDQSLEMIRQELEDLERQQQALSRAPVFLLGFSQGAVMVHKAATLVCDDTFISTWRKSIDKCILVSGFPFRTAATEIDRTKKPALCKTLPSLHVVGSKDHRVSPSLTRQVYQQEPCFQGKYSVWEHFRGHVVPTDQAFCNCLLEFLEKEG